MVLYAFEKCSLEVVCFAVFGFHMSDNIGRQVILPKSMQLKGNQFRFDFSEVDLMCLHIENHYHMMGLLKMAIEDVEGIDGSKFDEDIGSNIQKALEFLNQELESLQITSITRNNVVRL